MLAGDPQGLAARREHGDTRRGDQEPGDVRSRVHDLLDVVEHQQVLTCPDLGRKVALDREGVRDRRQDNLGIADRRQVDERDAVVVRLDELLCCSGREACLPDAAGPGDRDGAGPVARQADEVAELALSPDQRVQVDRRTRLVEARNGGNSLCLAGTAGAEP